MYDFSDVILIIKGLLDGTDPVSGEIFDPRDLYNNVKLNRCVNELALITAGRKKPESRNRLNRPSGKIFEDLRSWRLGKAKEKDLAPYCIFSDKELWAIAEGDVTQKEDLLFVKGISDCKYEEYGDELLEVLQKFF